MSSAAGFIVGVMTFLQSPLSSEAEAKAILFPYYARQAAAYEFFIDASPAQKLELRREPLLSWTNSDSYLGSVFVWTLDGRPEVVGCVGSRHDAAGECRVFHELQSLSLG